MTSLGVLFGTREPATPRNERAATCGALGSPAEQDVRTAAGSRWRHYMSRESLFKTNPEAWGRRGS